MAHLNDVYLPDGIETGAVYGPAFLTEIAEQESGREFRNRTRPDSLRVGELSFAPRLEEDYPELLNIFLIANGRFNSFRFTDLSDFECTAAQGVVRALSGSTAQLVKTYAVGSHTHLRDIQQPIAAGIVIKNGASTLTVTTDYTLADATGIVTWVGTPPADLTAVTWSGNFDNAVRFDTDRMATSFAAAQVLTWGGISIKEVAL